MTLFLKYDFNTLCKAFLQEHLNALDIKYSINSINDIELYEDMSEEKQLVLHDYFKRFGIEIITNQKSNLVERIKTCIDKWITDKSQSNLKLSSYIAENLNYSYTYLSTVFSESTYTSIENYAILRKVDLVKELICNTDLTLTEIAFQLNYSSVAHLSSQFKKVTGLTPTSFQNIMINKKKYNLNASK